jgi:3-hydroxyacyl-[acyl-carrier-protein] dehydratase
MGYSFKDFSMSLMRFAISSSCRKRAAQLAGLLGLDSIEKEKAENTVYYFAGVDKARFKKPVVPGGRLEMEARYGSDKRGIWRFECEAWVDGQVACQAEIMCAEREIHFD